MCVYTSVTFFYSEMMHKFGFLRGRFGGALCVLLNLCVCVFAGKF